MAEQRWNAEESKADVLRALRMGEPVTLRPSRRAIRRDIVVPVGVLIVGVIVLGAGQMLGWAAVALAAGLGWLANKSRTGFLELTSQEAAFKGAGATVVTIRREDLVAFRVERVGRSWWVLADLTPGGALRVGTATGVARRRTLPLPLVAGHDPREVGELLEQWLSADAASDG